MTSFLYENGAWTVIILTADFESRQKKDFPPWQGQTHEKNVINLHLNRQMKTNCSLSRVTHTLQVARMVIRTWSIEWDGTVPSEATTHSLIVS